MDFIDEHQLPERIRQGLTSSAKSVLAVAFWGAGAMESLGLADVRERVTVICNLSMGGTNPKEIRRIMDIGIRVLGCNDLHGKVYLFNDFVIIGSSNASNNGLSLQTAEMRGWREANVLSESVELIAQAKSWIETLHTYEVTDEHLKKAARLWQIARTKGIPETSQSLLDAMLKNPHFFDGKAIYLALCGENLDNRGRRAFDKVQRDYGEKFEIFQDWPDLQKEGYLVTFNTDSTGQIEYDGIFERRPEPPDWVDESIQLCVRVDNALGLSISPLKRKEWFTICRRLQKTSAWNRIECHGFMSMEDVVLNLIGEPSAS